jgi:hypothetical protein
MGIKVISRIELNQILGNRNRVEKERSAFRLRTLAQAPFAGNAISSVEQLIIYNDAPGSAGGTFVARALPNSPIFGRRGFPGCCV